MKSYLKGYNRELLARKILTATGYQVIRSAGSKGPWDLIAIDDSEVLLIQVRSRKLPVSKQADYNMPKPGPRVLKKEFWNYTGRNTFNRVEIQ